MKKKILITGAAGFIGSHLSEYFAQKGFAVRAFDRYNSFNSFGWLDHSKFKKDMDCILGDVRDYDSVSKAMNGCVGVIHLAALIGIPYSYHSPLAYIKTNVEGTYNVLEAAKNFRIKNIITTSTSEIYGSAEYLPIDEKHPINCQSPYAASKAAADQIAISFYRSFKLPVKILRPFNTYGPRQSARAIIPSIIAQCIKNKKNEILLGNLEPTRDLSYIDDTCSAFYHAYNCKRLVGQIVNSGANNCISMKFLAHQIAKLMGRKIKIKKQSFKIRPTQSEVQNLKCNNKKIRSFTKWKPKIKLEDGLLKTIKWVKKNISYFEDTYSL